jgi:hypothetical protein
MDGTSKLEIETSLLFKIAKRQGHEHKPLAFKSPPSSPLCSPFRGSFIMLILKFQESLEMCACPKLLISGVLLIHHDVRVATRSTLLFIVSITIMIAQRG